MSLSASDEEDDTHQLLRRTTSGGDTVDSELMMSRPHTRLVSEELTCTTFGGETFEIEELGFEYSEGPSTTKDALANLVNTSVGAGVLALPAALRIAGLVLGSLMIIALAILSNYSLKLIGRAGSRLPWRQWTYADVGAHYLGPRVGPLLVSLATVLNNFGTCTAYLIIIGDGLVDFVPHSLAHVVLLQRASLVVLVMVFVVGPLSMMRSLAALAYLSFASLAVIVVLAFVIVGEAMFSSSIRSSAAFAEPLVLFNWSWRSILALPLITFAFSCHTNLMPIAAEMQFQPDEVFASKPKVTGRGFTERVWRRFLMAVNGASATVLSIYLTVAIAGYVSFRSTTRGNLFTNYGQGDALLAIMKVSFLLSITATYPMSCAPTRIAIDRLLFGAAPSSARRHYVETALICIFTTALAIVWPSVVAVFGLTGATAAMCTTFLIPALCRLRMDDCEVLAHVPGDAAVGFTWSAAKVPALGLAVAGLMLGSVGTAVVLLAGEH